MSLETLHIKIGDEVDNSDGPRDEGDVVEFGARPLDHLEKALHHSARDESIAAGFVRGLMEKEITL